LAWQAFIKQTWRIVAFYHPLGLWPAGGCCCRPEAAQTAMTSFPSQLFTRRRLGQTSSLPGREVDWPLTILFGINSNFDGKKINGASAACPRPSAPVSAVWNFNAYNFSK
jgi:hypothetical protein